jgi:two-component system response regulator YesN
MYDVLIVDDEPVARQSLRYLIDWEQYGFVIRAEAENGQQALSLLKEHTFSLVLTDIRMPIMNGLELIARMKSFAADTDVVVLSGYDDFEYAREAMKLGVKEYLLKPVDEEDLIELLKRTAASIAEARLSERQHRLGMSAIRDQFLRKLTHGGMNSKEYEEQLSLLEMGRLPERYCCLIVELDFVYGKASFASESESVLSERDVELKRYAARNISEEVTGGLGFLFEESEERYGILCAGEPGEVTPSTVRELAERLSRSVNQYAKETVTIGIGTIVDGFQDAPASFAAAEQALDRKFLTGAGTILEGRDNSLLGNDMNREQVQMLSAELLESVRGGDSAAAHDTLAALWQSFQGGGVPANQAKLSVVELFVQLYRIVRESGASHEGLFDHALGDYESVMHCKTMSELLAITERKCEDVCALLMRGKELRPNKIVDEVKRLIQEQYGGNVSLKSVAQQIYMNPNYLGKLFKATTAMTFNDYLLQTRMEKAKELLLQSDLKVYEIAGTVGYNELDWFYKRFKAYTGVSTSEYRSAR